MSVDKGAFYLAQLQAALTAGQWESAAPGKTPYSAPLSWSELLRKFRKHCPNEVDVAEAASQTHWLSLLLGRNGSTAAELDAHGEGPWGTLSLGDECILQEGKRDDAEKAFQQLQQLNSSNNSVALAIAYFSYSLDRPEQCRHNLSNVESLFDGFPPSQSLAELDGDKSCRMTECLRTRCLQGMAQEKVSETASAEATYAKGITLLSSFSIPRSLPSKPGHADMSNSASFVKFRELWRWSERLMWRSIVLQAQHTPTESYENILPLFRLYSKHSVHWPATFRPWHRSTVLTLHLRTLMFLASDPACRTKTFSGLGKQAWITETRSLVTDLRSILDANTHFPRSGERNVAVEDFVDLCVAVWEAAGAVGEQAGWVLDILWWGTRLTFNSQKILRHMTRLMHASGDNMLAKRSLNLYVQIVTKAREAAAGSVDDVADTDRQFIQTLVQGARMLCRLHGGVEEAREAGKLIERARAKADSADDELVASIDLAEGIQQATLALREEEPLTRPTHLSSSLKHLLNSVDRFPTPSAHYHAAIALSRPGVECDIPRSINLARKAIEAEPRELRFWHLLALLEGKAGEWKKAKGVLEAAGEFAEEIEDELREEEQRAHGIQSRDFADTDGNTISGRQSRETDRAHNVNEATTANGHENGSSEQHLSPLLSSDEVTMPRSGSLLLPLPDYPPPSHKDLFEHAVQLRMTELSLTELLIGPDGAELQWPNVFAWFAERTDLSAQNRASRVSLDGRASAIVDLPLMEDPSAEKILDDEEARQRSGSIDGTNITTNSAANPMPTITIHPEKDVSFVNNANVMNEKSSALGGTYLTPGDHTLLSPDREKEKEKDKDTAASKGKKVQRMLKERVNKGQARFNTVSRKIGNGVKKGAAGTLQRRHSLPDFHAVLSRSQPYQASSIHSRKRISWGSRSHRGNSPSPIPSLEPPPPPPVPSFTDARTQRRSPRERRLLSDLWLMSAATFRRLGKIEQTRAAIQEAEILDEENEAVWVQLGLYFSALGDDSKAIEAFQKALFISIDDCSATLHMARQYLTMAQDDPPPPPPTDPDFDSSKRIKEYVDVAAGLLENLTKRNGWDVTEAWYFLAKAYGLRGQRERERECLVYALGLAETRGGRDIGAAVGWCL